MARLDAKWLDFGSRGQAWDHFWQDASVSASAALIIRGLSTLVEQASGTSLVVTTPGSLADGDVLVAVIACDTSVSITHPSGWTQSATVANSVPQSVYLVYHVVTSASGEPSDYTWTNIVTSRATGIMAGYRNVDNVTPIDVTASTQSSAGTTLDITSITTATDNAMLISAALINAASAATLVIPVTMSELQQATGTGRRASLADENDPTAGATGTRTWTQTGTVLAMAGVLTALRYGVYSAPSTDVGAPYIGGGYYP